jgi:hypothetical protein
LISSVYFCQKKNFNTHKHKYKKRKIVERKENRKTANLSPFASSLREIKDYLIVSKMREKLEKN